MKMPLRISLLFRNSIVSHCPVSTASTQTSSPRQMPEQRRAIPVRIMLIRSSASSRVGDNYSALVMDIAERSNSDFEIVNDKS
jgi:hypothetical protein